MKNKTISDIHSYTVFANIHDREKEKIEGYMVLLDKEAYELIESIIVSSNVRVKDEATYELKSLRGIK